MFPTESPTPPRPLCGDQEPHLPHQFVMGMWPLDCAGFAPIAPNGCDDCSVEPGERHLYAACPAVRPPLGEPLERSDLPEGQQLSWAEAIAISKASFDEAEWRRQTLAEHEAASAPCCDHADIEARVRTQVAEDLARLVESLCPDPTTVHVGEHCDFADAAAVIREHAGKPAESVVAALPDVVGTRQQVGRCGDAMPPLVNIRPRHFCALPAGHLGWHRSDEGAEWTHGGSTAGGGGEADLSKGLKDPVWWLHRCNPQDPKLSWLSETPGEPRPLACPRCGGAGWGWFEARPVAKLTERDDLTGADAGESTLPASRGVPVPRAETEDGGTQ